MKLCISGALGHIGSRLVRNLSIPGLETVYLVDNLSTQRYAALFDLPGDIDFVFKQIDIRSEEMASIIGDSDVLIHLAAITDAEKSFERNDDIEEINKEGLASVARLCADEGCAILFPSSTSVYGSQSELVDETCPEEDLQPQSPYADSKLFGERLLSRLGMQSDLRFVTFRLGTIFGYSRGMRFHTAVNKFIWQASTDQPITVWKTALTQKRPYCGLDDCIGAINFFITNNLFLNDIYNIVTTNLTVQDIIIVIEKYLPDLGVSLVDSPIMNQLSYEVSNRKSLDLGFTYHDDLESSVRDVLHKLKHVNSVITHLNM